MPQRRKQKRKELEKTVWIDFSTEQGIKYPLGKNLKPIIICTYNIQTLRTKEKQEELEYALEGMVWDVIGLCEIRRNYEALQEQKEGYLLFHSEAENSEFGTCFMVKNNLKDNVKEFNPVSKRIAALRLKFKSQFFFQ